MRNSRDFGAESVRDWLTDISPILIIGTFLLSLLSFGVLKFNYHQELFSEKLPTIGTLLAAMIAFVSQIARFAFGLAGVRDIVRGRVWLGWSGVLASVILSIYEHFEASRMAIYWENPDWWYAFVFLVWLALATEIRLLMTMSEKQDSGSGLQESRSNQNGQSEPAYRYEN